MIKRFWIGMIPFQKRCKVTTSPHDFQIFKPFFKQATTALSFKVSYGQYLTFSCEQIYINSIETKVSANLNNKYISYNPSFFAHYYHEKINMKKLRRACLSSARRYIMISYDKALVRSCSPASGIRGFRGM